jgi:sugar-specific transcriptional regulator TrmB
MTSDPSEDPNATAVEQLEQFGLSTYAAKTFVALVGLGTATAREVSEACEVPRTRVYDAVEELHDRGLVDVMQSSPKRFWASSAETTTRTFENELRHRTGVLRTALGELESVERQSEQRGVWTIDGRQTVTERVVEWIENADSEVVYMSVEDLLDEDVVDALAAAADRGVSIYIGNVSQGVKERVQAAVPDATTFESLWVWSDASAGRLLVVDGQQTLVSTLLKSPDTSVTDPRSETAIWGAGETNSLVVVLKSIFTCRLEENRERD